MIPVLIKIYKLIINELSTQIENSLMQQPAGGEDDDDEEEEVSCFCTLVVNMSSSHRNFLIGCVFL